MEFHYITGSHPSLISESFKRWQWFLEEAGKKIEIIDVPQIHFQPPVFSTEGGSTNMAVDPAWTMTVFYRFIDSSSA